MWGSEHQPLEVFLDNVFSAGYDGVEMHTPSFEKDQARLALLLQERGLLLLAQQYLAPPFESFDSYRTLFENNLRLNTRLSPVLVNSHTGRDFFSVEQNCQLLNVANKIASETSVTVTHETHRGRFSYSASAVLPYLKRYPQLKYTADFSHWCCVSESLLEDQEYAVSAVCRNSYHIHARVGCSQSPQVPDPRDPFWKAELDAHLKWWDAIVQYRRETETATLYITVEFGPVPYTMNYPFENKPLSNQWEINEFMLKYLKQRYL